MAVYFDQLWMLWRIKLLSSLHIVKKRNHYGGKMKKQVYNSVQNMTMERLNGFHRGLLLGPSKTHGLGSRVQENICSI
jgi:hypothetical protein